MKLSETNVACEDGGETQADVSWEHCFTTKLVEGKELSQVSVNSAKEEWIINSGCSRYVTGNELLLSK